MSALTQLSLQLPAQPAKRGAPKANAITSPNMLWDAAAACAYVYGDGNRLYRSKDLLRWDKVELDMPLTLTQPGVVLLPKEEPFQPVPEYRCYTVDGNSIRLIVSSRAEGPYLPRGTVLQVYPGDEAAAACPQPFADPVSREHYLVYGKDSAIYVLHLNPRNGMAYETGQGVCLARRPSWAKAISFPSLAYYAETGYYYLTVTYGNETDGNIRVGRSKSITGPYVDAGGRVLTDVEDFDARVGTMLAAGYRLDDHDGWAAPINGKLLQAGELGWMLALTAKNSEGRVFQIRRVIWTDDGWPVVSPECYGGETWQPAKAADLPGRYEIITFVPRLPQAMTEFVKMELLTPAVQGVSSTRNDWAYKIAADSQGRVELGGSHRGSWVWKNDRILEIRYPNFTQTLYVLPAWDWELGEGTMVLTGLDSKGQAVWAKRRDLPPRRRP